ncbi:Fe-S protein assembly co-chaperone HscB [Parachitinimonas caeni]|uniref:Co-chaperone protein HscB homolog n=1 Tax=Parachitinimonas caeni TaxID=3031301 RepID=A0ABT7DX55_9NEIS|nr:Fe-S protein assembly co-chaperone HscB [Parachitinimonas caeni]MDK2124648.1 Fe-S protein assembly co-chaperone HscB [Parachitinimonas caeni]
MSFDFSDNHFSLFGLPVQFRQDVVDIEAVYRTLQAQYHPDRAVTGSDSDKRFALQAATHINDAFHTLKSPLARARYLLKLQGFDTQEETNTSMPADFLMQQMEWREAIAEAKQTHDLDELEALATQLRSESRSLTTLIAGLIDDKQDFNRAGLVVRKLRFIEKLEQEIGDAIEALLD